MLKKIRVSFGGITQEFMVESQSEELTPEEENKLLKDKINKAIDIIEYNMQYDDNIDDYWVTTNKLLEILKENY